jgi:hypothetical protein
LASNRTFGLHRSERSGDRSRNGRRMLQHLAERRRARRRQCDKDWRRDKYSGSLRVALRANLPLTIGNRVTVEYRAVVHGCIVDDDCLIGRGAIVLNGARLGRGSIVEQGAVVMEGAQSAPAKFGERERAGDHSKRYVEIATIYRAEPAQPPEGGQR